MNYDYDYHLLMIAKEVAAIDSLAEVNDQLAAIKPFVTELKARPDVVYNPVVFEQLGLYQQREAALKYRKKQLQRKNAKKFY